MAMMPPQRTLPVDQQAMQDDLASNAQQAATDVANTAVGARDAIRYGGAGVNMGSKLLTGKNLINAGALATRFNPPVLLYSLADMGVGMARDDGKGMSQLIGEGLGGYIGNLLYGKEIERMSKPVTQAEIDASPYRKQVNNELSSIPLATAGISLSNSPTETKKPEVQILPNDPMTPENQKILDDLKRMEMEDNIIRVPNDPMTSENLRTLGELKEMEYRDLVRNNLPDPQQVATLAMMQEEGPKNLQEAYEASGQFPVGMTPRRSPITDAQILEQRRLRELEQQPRAQSLADAYGQIGVDPRALQFAGGGTRPDGVESYTGITTSGNRVPIDKATLDAFTKNQESQKSASGLMRREFDSTPVVSATPEAGLMAFEDARGNIAYGNETARQMFSADAIEQNLADRAKAEQAPEAPETPLEAPVSPSETPTPPSTPEEAPAPEGTPDEEKTAEQLEYEKEMAEDDEALAEWGRRNNKSPEYMEEMMAGINKRRKEEAEAKKLEDLLTELRIEKETLGNIRLKQLIESAELPDDVDLGDVKTFRGMMEDMGLSQDPETGAITITEEGFWSDTNRPLSSNSSIFYMLDRHPAGRYILNMTPPEINTVENPDSSLAYPTKDGRFFTWSDEDEEWSLYLPRPASADFTILDENGLVTQEEE